jgi:hypothetical protein
MALAMASLPPQRRFLLIASIAWLATGYLFALEGFGIPAFVYWRPLVFIAFLAVNAFAAAVVVAEFAIWARPEWHGRRGVLLQAVAGGLLFVSVMVYLEFMQTHAVTARAY